VSNVDYMTRAVWPPLIVWAPAALIGLAMLLPLAYLAIRTLGSVGEAWEFLFRFRVLQTLGRTALLVLTVTVASVAIAVPLSWLTVRTNLPFKRAWTIVIALPLVIPSYVAGFLFVVTFGPRGLLQQALSPLGVDRLPEIYGFPGAMLTLTLLSFPYVLFPVRAALWQQDPSLEESSRSMGNSIWSTFRRVNLPLLRPAIASGALLVALYTLSDFGAVSLLRYETFTWSIYLQYESALDRTLASAFSVVLMILAVGIMLLESTTRGRARYYRVAVGSVRSPHILRLRWWLYPALFLCTITFVVSVAIPMSVLIYWVVRGVASGESVPYLWSATRNSLIISGVAAMITVVASMPLAVLTVRYKGRISGLLEPLSYTGFILPGVVIALALVFFAANFVPVIYQTAGLLVFAYVVLFLPVALGAIRPALLQVTPSIEEAARGLGKSPLAAFTAVTMPLVRWGILAAVALVFLLTMKELQATLILSPIGFTTLATSIWSSASEAFFAQAAVPALFLIITSSIPMAFLISRERGEAR
jgi:iron(III) transport system permease protein